MSKKHVKRMKFKRRDVARFLMYLRECLKWVVIADEGEVVETPKSKERKKHKVQIELAGTKMPEVFTRLVQIADEYTSGVNGDIGRLRDATRAALSKLNQTSVSGEAAIATDITSQIQMAKDHDKGFADGAHGYDGPAPSTILFPQEYERGQEKGLERYNEMTPEQRQELEIPNEGSLKNPLAVPFSGVDDSSSASGDSGVEEEDDEELDPEESDHDERTKLRGGTNPGPCSSTP